MTWIFHRIRILAGGTLAKNGAGYVAVPISEATSPQPFVSLSGALLLALCYARCRWKSCQDMKFRRPDKHETGK
jgi:hypothetical protein